MNSRTAGEADPTLTRDERRLLTRAQLLSAALQLMGTGRSFASLSLREITREAGVVPAAFYRHFPNLDELGLALVEESGATLRRLLREARRTGL
ncbi:MAG: TetR family transcriptional regulator, partial [Aquimonas sp.]